jgi:hypothetical protein
MSPTDPSQSVISCQKASCRCIYQKSVDILGPSPVRLEQQQPKKQQNEKRNECVVYWTSSYITALAFFPPRMLLPIIYRPKTFPKFIFRTMSRI